MVFSFLPFFVLPSTLPTEPCPRLKLITSLFEGDFAPAYTIFYTLSCQYLLGRFSKIFYNFSPLIYIDSQTPKKFHNLKRISWKVLLILFVCPTLESKNCSATSVFNFVVQYSLYYTTSIVFSLSTFRVYEIEILFSLQREQYSLSSKTLTTSIVTK